ncbi:hypothetical protein [Halarchaeum nitratireducens]|uniref:Uncharacterized protein n=1 Tax=Halarchaeum nitratireducens TaxID=489913 RepID=A0A830G8V3_9EURY|nr:MULTISPECIES: hypothetical protein [Halarchaeum]MBP2250057.1 hypothetical protein [Halarchaeum solikamskense]GGN08769.1 hypothetical protein GCM10009021_05250 [Halarchaeum nitratireducens]
MTQTDASERTLPAGIDRPDAVLGAITVLLVAALAATVVAPYAAMPTLAVGCLGCLCLIGEAVFVNPPIEG